MINGNVLRRTRYGVKIEGVDVVLVIGDRWFRFDYDTANKLAVMLRGQARKAKRNAGDDSTKIIGFADLTDATLDEIKAQANRDRTAVFARR